MGAIAAIVIIFMGLKYLQSGDDSDARYMARVGIIGAFVGILIVVLAVPFVNIVASGLIGTVECGFFPSISGGGDPAGNGPVTPAKAAVSGPEEKSADIAAKGFSLTKRLSELKDDEFPLFFQVANVGTLSSPGFMNTVSMMSDLNIIELCKVPSLSLPAGGETFSYSCSGAGIVGVKEMLSSGKPVTLKLTADSDHQVEKATDTNWKNNELSQVLSPSMPVKKIDEMVLGPKGGLEINSVSENK